MIQLSEDLAHDLTRSWFNTLV